MNIEYQRKVHLTFETTKGTSELLNKFAKIKGMTQPQLIDSICNLYIQEALIEAINIIPENTFSEIIKTE